MVHPASVSAAHIEHYERKLRIKVTAWAESDQGKEFRFTDQLRLLPDLFALTAKLLVDDAVPSPLRPPLLGAVMYVLSPVDLLPENLLGVAGLTDDLIVCAMVLDHLQPQLPESVLAAHWQSDRSLAETLAGLLESAEDMTGGRLLQRIRDWVAGN